MDTRKEMKVVDLFCGAGGLSLGLAQAGFKIVAAYDNWKKAIETYKRNFNHSNIKVLDLTQLKDKNHPEILEIKKINPEIVVGGPPCQDFSSAGKRNGDGERGNLTPLFAEIVVAISPEWAVMENVNTIKSTGEEQLKKAKKTLHEAGYGISTMVLNAADFGAPQNRKRFFLIARKGGKDGEMEEYIKRQKKQKISVKDYFSSLGDNLGGFQHYYRHPRSYGRRAIFSIDELSPTIRGVSRPMPKNYKFHKGDTIKNRNKIMVMNSEQRATVQTFPKDFEWIGVKSEVELQIGNSVPPVLASAIAKAIKDYEKSNISNYI